MQEWDSYGTRKYQHQKLVRVVFRDDDWPPSQPHPLSFLLEIYPKVIRVNKAERVTDYVIYE